MGRPSALVRRWILVEKPPRERPSDWPRIPFLCRRHSGVPGSRYCRSSATHRRRRRCRPGLAAARPTVRSWSSGGIAATLSSSGPVRSAGRATARRCARSRRSHPAPAGGQPAAGRPAASVSQRTARTAPILRPSSIREPQPTSMTEVSHESRPPASGEPPSWRGLSTRPSRSLPDPRLARAAGSI